MATVFLAALLTIATCTTAVSSLECYRCVREDNSDALKYCKLSTMGNNSGNNNNISCSSGEDRCAIRKTIQKDGTVTTFSRLCATSSNCMSKCTPPDTDGVVVCESCCEEDLCNRGEGPKSGEQSGASRMTALTMTLCEIVGLFLFVSFA